MGIFVNLRYYFVFRYLYTLGVIARYRQTIGVPLGWFRWLEWQIDRKSANTDTTTYCYDK